MTPVAFEPEFMPLGVLTAALQELTPRERRDPDPDLAAPCAILFGMFTVTVPLSE